MSCSLYITRAASFVDSLDSPITNEEWLDLVRQDETLALEEGSDGERAIWSNPEDLQGYYSIQCFDGAISADITSNAVIRKLLELALKLDAVVLDEGDHHYIDDSGYPVDRVASQPQI
jgi:hypothetical protein